MEKQAVIHRLIELIDEFDGGIYSKFALRVGTRASTFQTYLNGKTLPSMEMIAKICENTGINADWLIFGINPKYRHKRDLHELPEHSLTIMTTPEHKEYWDSLEDPRNFKTVPILDSIAAGPARMVDEKDISGFAVIYQDWLYAGRHVCFRVDGDSMKPILATGDLVGVNLDRRDPQELHGGVIAAYVDDGITVKHFRLEEDRAILIPENISEYSPREYPLDQLDTLIIGLVEWSWKKMH